MADMASNNTIDLIVQSAYKYRLISKPGRTLFGRALIQANAAAVGTGEVDPSAYRFTSFPRKFKRDAVACAIHYYITQAEQASTWEDSEEQRLVGKVADKNAVKARHFNVTDDEYDDDGDWVATTVVTTAFAVHIAALTVAALNENGSSTLPWQDITDEQRDADTEAGSVMVRPIEVIQAERDAERARVMAERTAASQADAAAYAAVESYTDDEDDDDWPEDGED